MTWREQPAEPDYPVPRTRFGETFGIDSREPGSGGGLTMSKCVRRPTRCDFMEAFLVSTGVVALAEIGDKTQLLALLLAARYRQPVPILLGIFVATLANHALAGLSGAWLASLFEPALLRWIIGLSFLAVAGWMLIPDKLDEDDAPRLGRSAFIAATVSMFLAEMGDKTQIATIVLGARFDALVAVIAGTTLGMMIANTPAVLLGEAAARHVPLKLVHGAAAAIFAVVGITVLLGFGTLS